MSSNQMNVSVIVPVYNTEVYLERCLNSLLNQELDGMEIILVDDGSTDASGKICDIYAQSDNRLRVIHKENGGLVSARKGGLLAAQGRYIGFVDSDDWIEDGMFQALYDKAVEHEADLAAEGMIEDRNESTLYLKNAVPDGVYTEDNRLLLLTNMLNCEEFSRLGIQPYLCNKLMKRELALKCIPMLDERIRIGEDAAAVYPMLADSKRTVITSGYHYHYCIRKESMMWTKRHDRKDFEEIRYLYQFLKKEFAERDLLPLLAHSLKRYTMNNLLVRVFWEYASLGGNVLFPFKGVHEGDSVIIYGAGALGRSVYEYAASADCLNVTSWVDQNAAAYQKLGLAVDFPDSLQADSDSKVIIAIFSQTAVDGVKKYLYEKGFAEKKIVWLSITQEEEAAILAETDSNDYAFSIFGAGMVAFSTAEAIMELKQKKPDSFVVSDPASNPKEIMGRPVISWEEYCNQHKKKDILVIAIPEPFHEEIIQSCKAAGVEYRCITSERENHLLWEYYKKKGIFSCANLKIVDELCIAGLPKSILYMACGSWDKPLKKNYKKPDFMLPLQVGKALSNEVIANVGDNTGCHISERNPYYCELTALYWIWKNVDIPYVGLCHYRRWFVIDEEELRQIIAAGIDVVLPYPSIQYPNAAFHEQRYIKSSIRSIIRDVLRENSLEDLLDYEEMMSDKYIYNFNMIIAKKDVLNDYCEWLFKMITKVEEKCREKQIFIEKRQQGYWGEVLLSFYFMKKRKRLSKHHAGRRILV